MPRTSFLVLLSFSVLITFDLSKYLSKNENTITPSCQIGYHNKNETSQNKKFNTSIKQKTIDCMKNDFECKNFNEKTQSCLECKKNYTIVKDQNNGDYCKKSFSCFLDNKCTNDF